MKVFGLTGGVGMGKSTCANLLRPRGFSVIDTDELARELVRPGQPALEEIRAAFGGSVFDASGQLRREVMADLVFRDAAARQRLEAILHPRILAAWTAQVERWRTQGRAAAVVVIPLLFETRAEARVDATVCVACLAETQRARLLARGWSAEETAQRIAAQMPIEQKMARADHVIWSEGHLDILAAQVEKIFQC